MSKSMLPSGPMLYRGQGAETQFDAFGDVAEVIQQSNSIKQQQLQAQQKALDSKRNAISTTLKGVREVDVSDIPVALQPAWYEVFEIADAGLNDLYNPFTKEPIETPADGQKLAATLMNTFNYLKGATHDSSGNNLLEESRANALNLVNNPITYNNFDKQLPYDQTFMGVEGINNQIGALDDLSTYKMYGATPSDILMNEVTGVSNWASGTWRDHMAWIITPNGPRLQLFGNVEANGEVNNTPIDLQQHTFYGANSAQIYSFNKFTQDVAASSIENVGSQILTGRVKTKQGGTGWGIDTARQEAIRLLEENSKDGQNARRAFIDQAIAEGVVIDDAKKRAFVFRSPEIAFSGAQFTVTELNDVKADMDAIFSNEDYLNELIQASRYDQVKRKDDEEAPAPSDLETTLALMSTTAANDLYAFEDIISNFDPIGGNPALYSMSNANDLLRLNQAYTSLYAETQNILGDIRLDPTRVRAYQGPGFAVGSVVPNERAGVTRQFLNNFNVAGLPQVKGRFGVTGMIGTANQFSPEIGVDGNPTAIFVMSDGTIGVKINPSAGTPNKYSFDNRKIIPIGGQYTYNVGDPILNFTTSAIGITGFDAALGTVAPGDSYAGTTYETGSAEIVYYFDPVEDKSQLEALGLILDDHFEVKNKTFTPYSRYSGSFGHTLNRMLQAAN